MKPELLRGKKRYTGFKLYSKEEIKSAIEWLKKELDNEPIQHGGDERGHKLISLYQIKCFIDEAFQDVIK